jgi:hypothetical protein
MTDRERELLDEFHSRLKKLVIDFKEETGYEIGVIDGDPLDDTCYFIGYYRHPSNSSASAN